MTLDEKVQDIALGYILQHTGQRTEWPFTIVGKLHVSLTPILPLAKGELPIVSAFFSGDSWYAFTTRRIVGRFDGSTKSIDPKQGINSDFRNFKGYGPSNPDDPMAIPPVEAISREVATIGNLSGEVDFEFETFQGALPPMYACRYWDVKHPFLHKLMTRAERAALNPRVRRLDVRRESLLRDATACIWCGDTEFFIIDRYSGTSPDGTKWECTRTWCIACRSETFDDIREPVRVAPDAKGWITCPCCGYRFEPHAGCLRNVRLSEERHSRCLQRLIITQPANAASARPSA